MGTPPPEPPTPPPAAEQAAAARPTCPRCGAPHDPYQEYCLECGLRLVPLPGPYYRREIWSRESPIWLWLALAALLIVALAGALAAVAASKDEKEGSPVVQAGSSQTETIGTFTEPATLTVGPPTTAPTVTTILPTTTFGTTTFATTTAPTTTTTPSGTTISWPSGKDGYTVVLRSTPTSDGRGPAEAAAQRAVNAGLPEVGILDSTNYSSLRSGYYVTFTGVYDTLNEAEAALPRARSAGFPLAYVREVAD
jgi:hypothetical protein